MATTGFAAAAAPLAAQTPVATSDITLDLGVRYDTNIARSTALRAEQRGLERSDVVFNPSIRIDVTRPFGDNSAFLRGSLGYVFHARNSVLDRERLQLDGGADVGVGPCRVRPEAGFFRGQSDLADLVVSNGAIVDDARNTETLQRYSVELQCGAEYGLQPFASVGYDTARNSNPIRDRAEYDAWRYSAGLGYNSPGLGRIRLFASQTDTDLVSQPLAGGGTDGYRVNAFGLDYSREIGTRLTFNGRVSYSRLDPRNSGADGFSGLTWRIAPRLLLGERIQVEGLIGRELTNSLASDSAYTVSQPYGLRVTYAASEFLRLDAGATITRRRYEFAVLPPVDFIDRETRHLYDINASYLLGRRIRLRLGAGHERRDANGSLFDYSSTFVTAGLGLTF